MDEKVPLSERPDRGAAESLDYERLRERLVRAVSRTCPAWLGGVLGSGHVGPCGP